MKTYQDQIQQLTAQCNKWAERCSAYVNAEQTYGTHEELAAQLAAAREALTFIGTHTEHGDQDPCPICEAVDKALASPSPAADALLENRTRLKLVSNALDRLLHHIDEGMPSMGFRYDEEFRIAKDVLDAARKASTKEGA